jgi:hypothetical protein
MDSTAGRKLARCALLVALLALGAQGFMPRPSKQQATTQQPHHMQPRRQRAATPTTRLGSTPMVDNSPLDVEAAAVDGCVRVVCVD